MAKRRTSGTKGAAARKSPSSVAKKGVPAQPRAAAAAAALPAPAPPPPPVDALTGFLGDGSRGAGNVPPIPGGIPNFQFTDFTVPINFSLPVFSGTVFRCRGTFLLDGIMGVEAGTAAAEAIPLQYAPSSGVSDIPARSGNLDTRGDENQGRGGFGGTGGRALGSGSAPWLLRPTHQGGAPGISGLFIITPPGAGSGGGTLVIRANRIVIDGLLRADGGDGTPHGGSGGGGGIIVLAARQEIVIAGRVTANGGHGGDGAIDRGGGGGGGGGIIHLVAPVITEAPTITPRLEVGGGAGGASFANALHTLAVGGAGGGGSGGGGGDGGRVQDRFAHPGEPGLAGQVIRTIADPVGLFG